ncbi:hypothetical protein Np200711_098 [Cyanophage S-RIM44]|uniref:Glycine-rich domain-containing protein n=1 Tax=Cyanophage S-RIM44 TaxID=1278485 RepID=A0A1D7SEH2_9CAUD|nr:hypothetical protein Np200711_098 [Cyanophage S-RIM44]
MSVLRVNELRSQTGNIISIPSGHELVLDTTPINSNALPPTAGTANSGKFLKSSNGSSIGWESVGPVSIRTYTSSGTWSRPAGVTKILVRLVGGGGAGSGVGESGAAGGYSERLLDVTSISSVSVTIGAGSSSSTTYSGRSGNGGTTSFGSYLSASGGAGANTSHQHCGGLPGIGSGGDINLYGGGGNGHSYYGCGDGGTSFFGGSGAVGHPQGGQYAHNNSESAGFGAGGGPGYHTSTQGAKGKGGVVVVYEFK